MGLGVKQTIVVMDDANIDRNSLCPISGEPHLHQSSSPSPSEGIIRSGSLKYNLIIHFECPHLLPITETYINIAPLSAFAR